MENDPERERLDDLDVRIREAEKLGGKAEENAVKPVKYSQTGYEFIGAILACAVIGWLADRWLHTKPWGLLGMLVVGFMAGIANVWRALNGYDQSVGLHKKDQK